MAKKPISAEEFAELQREFIRSDLTIKDFHAERLKGRVALTSFRARVSRAKWTQLRAEYLERKKQQSEKATEKALDLSATTQAETRTKYALRARRMADVIMALAERLNDGRKLGPTDAQRLTSSLRNAQQIEFAALGISADQITLVEEDAGETLHTIEELLKREREKKGLEPYEFGVG